MKKLLSFLFVLTFSFGLLFNAKADDTTKQEEPKRIIISPRPSHRQKAPSRQAISCLYFSDGTISIEFAYPEGEYYLSIGSSIDELTNVFTLNSSQIETIYVGEVSNAQIIIETENGQIYTGYIY